MSGLVIMLGHQAEVGKDTLGEMLIKKNGFVRLAFADYLKQTVMDLYNFTHDQMYNQNFKNVPDQRYKKSYLDMIESNASMYYTPREVLQDFGQEQRQRFPDIWADCVFRQIEKEPGQNFVITDFRFPNEYTVAARYAEQCGFDLKCVKITRDIERNFTGSQNVSETALNDFDYWDLVIENNGTIQELYDSASVLLNRSQSISVDLSFMER